ncbi:MAG: redoxin family protein [Phycisphaerales bacterium]|nr:redoxin family protein [Phycisphaerales bacterium]
MPRTAHVDDAASLGVGRPVPDLELALFSGDKSTISAQIKDRKGLVIALTGATCPMCVKYSPRLAALEKEFAAKGIAWVFVNPAEAETRGEIGDQIRKYRIERPYVADRDHRIARALGARTTTEVFLLDPSRTMYYRGAVDDQYGIGVTRDAPGSEYLRDAVEALVSGAPRPRVRATWSPGCLLDLGAAPAAEAGAPTYNGRIAWIMAENCVTCHRPGAAANAAPFALDSYEAVNARAKMIEAVVRDGLMPPWHGAARAEGEASPWVTDRSISPGDRDALLAWLRSDRPRGEASLCLPVPARLSNTWNIGEPDLLLLSTGMRLPVQGGLRHARVMAAFSPSEERWLSAIEFRPMEAGTVHHAVVWVLAPGNTLPATDQIPEGLELLGTYSPGDNVLRYPSGAARRVRPGSIFLIDLYGVPMGKEAISSLRLAMRFVPREQVEQGAVKWGVRSLVSIAPGFDGPTGDGPVTAMCEVGVPSASRVLAIQPIMRASGRSVGVELRLPDGTTRPVLAADRFDFRWQIRYEYAEPVSIAAGSRFAATGRYEAAAAGERRLVRGPGAGDDSLILSVEVLEPVVRP